MEWVKVRKNLKLDWYGFIRISASSPALIAVRSRNYDTIVARNTPSP
jgi:hypothetical protein